jgi:MtN3 and saliva related transmembrane protein
MLCGANKLAKEKNKLQQYKSNYMNIEILGLIAGTISSITFLPQVIKIWQTKSAKDLSIPMLLLLVLGVSLWLAYGIIIKNTPVIYTNSMVLFMSFIMLFFKFKYNK